jgi:shikimate kinase
VTRSWPALAEGRPERILLIGMMGAGKSTIGRRLADRLGWPYLDSDEAVKARTGRTIPEIFESSGEAAFRAEEAAVLAEATSAPGPAVVSVAGGAVLDPGNRRRIEEAGLVVWLRATVPTLAKRVGSGAGRPLLSERPAEQLTRLLAEREPLYRSLSGLTIDVDERAVDDIVATIERAARHGGETGAAAEAVR